MVLVTCVPCQVTAPPCSALVVIAADTLQEFTKVRMRMKNRVMTDFQFEILSLVKDRIIHENHKNGNVNNQYYLSPQIDSELAGLFVDLEYYWVHFLDEVNQDANN